MSASSELAPSAGITYGPDNLVDGIRTTCWAEGVSGYGYGEWFQFDFPSDVTVTQFRGVFGYDKHSGGVDRFWTNPQLKSFRVTFSDGSSQVFTVADTRNEQTVKLPAPVKTSVVKVAIDSVYHEHPGPHSAKDTSVSEFHVLGY